MKYVKKIFILFAIIATPFFSKANFECSCTVGSGSLGHTYTWFVVGADAGCSNPTAGAALDETMFQGQTIGYTYMSAPQAAALCDLKGIWDLWTLIRYLL